MNQIRLLVPILLLVPAAAPGYAWLARFSSAGTGFDHARAVVTDAAGNAYITGLVTTAGTGQDVMTLKYSPTGALLWQRQNGGPGNDAGVAIAYDPNTASLYVGGFYTGTSVDFYTIKYNAATGDTVWTRRYDGPLAGEDRAVALRLDNLGYVYVAGTAAAGAGSQAVVVKYSPSGIQTWATPVPSPNGDGRSSAAAIGLSLSRYAYICGAARDAHGTDDLFLARITEAGAVDWRRTWEGAGLADDFGTAVAVDDSGNVVAAGSSWSGSGNGFDYAVVKYGATGDFRWADTYNGPDDAEDVATAVLVDTRSNVYATGYSTGTGGDEDYLTARYTPTGTRLWTARYTGPGNDTDSATALAVRGNRVYVTGFSYRAGNPEMATVGYDTLGTQLWATRYYTSPAFDDEAFSIATVSDGVFFIAGEGYDDATGHDLLTLKYAERDFGVVSVTAPTGSQPPRPVAPTATVRNGGMAVETASVYMRIYQGGTLVYEDMQVVSDLNPNASRGLTFKNFAAGEGSYVARCSTVLAGDLYRENDTAGSSFTFIWTTRPAWYQMANVQPGLQMRAVKDGGALCYGRHNSSRFSVFGLKGNSTNEFYRFDVSDDTWITLDSLRYFEGRRKPAKKGAALAYDRYDTLVFAFKGNNTNEFWRYDVIADTWSPAESLPGGRRRVKGGSGLAFYHNSPTGQDYVYALKGNKTPEFYAYHVQTGTWEPKDSVPLTLNRGMMDGSCLTIAGSSIYALKGNYNTFYRYDIADDTWVEKRPLPEVGRSNRRRKVKNGAALTYSNDVVYALKAGCVEFWAYYVDADTWVELESMPRLPSTKVVKGGGALAYGGGYVWALKGNKTFEFFAYSIGSDADQAPDSRRDGVTASSLDIGSSSFVIAPNPLRSGLLSVSFTSSHIPQPSSLSIFDALGRLVLHSVMGIGHQSLSLDVRTLPSGVYLVRLTSPGFTATRKLVIER